MGIEDEQLYRELRLGHKALKGMGKDKLIWLGYFYDKNVPSVKNFLDQLAMTESTPPEDILSAFEEDLDAVIEHRIDEVLSIEEDLDAQMRKYILENWKSSETLFSALTQYLIGSGENSKARLAVLVMQDQEKIKKILEAARSEEGLIQFMKLCDAIAERMAKPEDKHFSSAAFLEDIKYLESLKQVVNPGDIKRLISMELYGREPENAEKRRGFRRLLKALDSRDFFKA